MTTTLERTYPSSRWGQLVIAIICMMSISSPQYIWTLFTHSLSTQLHHSLASIQITFSLLIVLQTFFSPLQGWLIQKLGIRLLVGAGCLLSGLSWVIASHTQSLIGLYLSYGVLGGIGTGFVYLGTIALMVRHFPDRRGMAVGAVAAGYGFGAMLTTFPISHQLDAVGLSSTLLEFGILFAVIGGIASLGIRLPSLYPQHDERKEEPLKRQFAPRQMLRTPLFWLLFLMFVMLATSGLMVTSQLASFAADMGVSNASILGMGAIPLALTLDRLCNGFTRPLFGWISDHLGRETTMCIAFGLEGLAMILWLLTIHEPILFVLLSGVVFLGWGEIFSLFPALLTDAFGTRHAAINYGFLYMAQGVGAIFGGPLAAWLHDATNSWIPIFVITILCDLTTALLSVTLLKRVKKNLHSWQLDCS